ncbi:MAG: dNTP triphosphohydrolase [Cytophagales bacterium]|nr:dNTP triphosphohydrolase [Cytophagales bacterium]
MEKGPRTSMERNWDKIIFSPFLRRLQGKTQVIPFPKDSFLHTRLTHSLETTSVGRSLGKMGAKYLWKALKSEPGLANQLCSAEKDIQEEEFSRHVSDVVKTACLAHDIGHPPFAHTGERAIRSYFKKEEEYICKLLKESSDKKTQFRDLSEFDSNAMGFYKLLREIKGLDHAVLAAYVKYPIRIDEKNSPDNGKSSIFFSDRKEYEKICEGLGVSHSDRHPLTFLVEAADDICYRIVDFEDAIHIGSIDKTRGEEHLIKLLKATAKAFPASDKSKYSIYEHMKEDTIVRMKGKIIHNLTILCAKSFEELRFQDLKKKSFKENKRLLERVKEEHQDVEKPLSEIEKLSESNFYHHPKALQTELSAHTVIPELLSNLISAVFSEEKDQKEEKIKNLFGYKESCKDENNYEKLIRICSCITDLTDAQALQFYKYLKP